MERLSLGAAFDSEKEINYDGFAFELTRRGHWTDALMFATFFCSPDEKDKYFQMYIQKYYSPKNPLFALLKLITHSVIYHSKFLLMPFKKHGISKVSEINYFTFRSNHYRVI